MVQVRIAENYSDVASLCKKMDRSDPEVVDNLVSGLIANPFLGEEDFKQGLQLVFGEGPQLEWIVKERGALRTMGIRALAPEESAPLLKSYREAELYVLPEGLKSQMEGLLETFHEEVTAHMETLRTVEELEGYLTAIRDEGDQQLMGACIQGLLRNPHLDFRGAVSLVLADHSAAEFLEENRSALRRLLEEEPLTVSEKSALVEGYERESQILNSCLPSSLTSRLEQLAAWKKQEKEQRIQEAAGLVEKMASESELQAYLGQMDPNDTQLRDQIVMGLILNPNLQIGQPLLSSSGSRTGPIFDG